MSFAAFIKNSFGLRQKMPLGFYFAGFFHKYILRKNIDVPWMVHHTSGVYHAKNIKRGRNVFPGDSPGNFIDAEYGISIGDYTNIGPNVGIITKNHDLVDNENYTKGEPVQIGAFCWIGMNAVVLPGVNLGDFTVVAAGAVVTKSFAEGYQVIGGNPATVIKTIDRTACEQYRKSKYQ